jgi:NAD(P)-dependent dehydrogenase (short-subunit alcohol dehydrogenase family)
MAPLVWLVTGTTSGLGASLVTHIASRGDKVIASGRNASKRLDHLKSESVAVLDLDVSAPSVEIDIRLKQAVALFGRIDVLVNNAGIGSPKAVEEARCVHKT